MKIWQLPEDGLAHILEYLNGYDLVNLERMCQMQFTRNVRRNTRFFEVEKPAFSLFPFSAYNLPSLEHFSVVLTQAEEKYPLRLDGRVLTPFQLQNRLFSLTFEFCGSLSVLQDSTLGMHAPNLQSLVIKDLYTLPSLKYLHQVPKSITKLILRTGPSNLMFRASITDFMKDLPPNLETLSINSLVLEEPLPNISREEQSWPERLKHLSVEIIPVPYFFDHMPPNLEVIHGLAVCKEETYPRSMNVIPKTMKIFGIVSFSKFTAEIKLDSPMPLELIKWDYDLTCNSIEKVSLISRKLENKDLIKSLMNSFPEAPILEWFPNIRDIDTTFGNLMDIPLPKNLTRIESHNLCDFHFIPLLPPSLTSLSVILPSPLAFRLLPRSLTSLSIYSKFTDINNSTFDESSSLEAWRSLPPKMTHLRLDIDNIPSVKCLGEIPETLKSITFWMRPPVSPTGPNMDNSLSQHDVNLVRFDESLPQYLPKGLESISISTPSGDLCAWVSWVSSMHHLLHLTFINITTDMYRAKIDTIPPLEKYFGNLPPSLTHLCVPIDLYEPISTTALAYLPTNLRKLGFICPNRDSGTPQSFSDHHFSHLPKKLSSIYWRGFQTPASLAQITPQVLQMLPPFLTTFPFLNRSQFIDSPQEPWDLAIAAYIDPEKWFGCPPSW